MKVPAFQVAIALTLIAAGCARHQADAKFAPSSVAYQNPYNKPLSTPGARFGALPTVVQNTVRSEAGTAEIVDVFKDISGKRVFYKICFRDPENFPPMFVGADGSVLNPDLTVCVPAPQEVTAEIKVADLPLPVMKAVQEGRVGGEIASASQEHWGDHTIYIVSFKDDVRHPKLYVVAEGTVLIQAPK